MGCGPSFNSADSTARLSFRRGTSFQGQLNVFGEDPHDILKKRVKPGSSIERNIDTIFELLDMFTVSKQNLLEFIDSFSLAMEKGLNTDVKGNADMKMIPTFVTKIPNGQEVGEFLALDLGGTNFRVLLLTMNGNPGTRKLTSNAFNIPETIMKGTGEALFDFIVDKISIFLRYHNIDSKKEMKLGFTFSFPVDQKALDRGTLVTWTKGFDCRDVVGKDIVEFLQKSIKRKKLNITVVALVNDTVGTLMSCAYTHPDCAVGMIVGTGTNACYLEDIANITELKGKHFDDKYMVINMEWGAYGDNDPEYNLDRFRTRYDKEIDMSSINPGKQKFEKLISGMYLGEIVRLIILDLFERNLIFERCTEHHESYAANRQPLYTKNAFYTKYVSEIETDRGRTFKKTKAILRQIGFLQPTLDDCAIVHFVCRLVSQRAAKLLAGAFVAVLTKIKRDILTVGIDGSLYRYHPTFMRTVEYYSNLLLEKHIDYKIKLAEDGSGMGAALAAAAAAATVSNMNTAINNHVSNVKH